MCKRSESSQYSEDDDSDADEGQSLITRSVEENYTDDEEKSATTVLDSDYYSSDSSHLSYSYQYEKDVTNISSLPIPRHSDDIEKQHIPDYASMETFTSLSDVHDVNVRSVSKPKKTSSGKVDVNHIPTSMDLTSASSTDSETVEVRRKKRKKKLPNEEIPLLKLGSSLETTPKTTDISSSHSSEMGSESSDDVDTHEKSAISLKRPQKVASSTTITSFTSTPRTDEKEDSFSSRKIPPRHEESKQKKNGNKYELEDKIGAKKKYKCNRRDCVKQPCNCRNFDYDKNSPSRRDRSEGTVKASEVQYYKEIETRMNLCGCAKRSATCMCEKMRKSVYYHTENETPRSRCSSIQSFESLTPKSHDKSSTISDENVETASSSNRYSSTSLTSTVASNVINYLYDSAPTQQSVDKRKCTFEKSMKPLKRLQKKRTNKTHNKASPKKLTFKGFFKNLFQTAKHR